MPKTSPDIFFAEEEKILRKQERSDLHFSLPNVHILIHNICMWTKSLRVVCELIAPFAPLARISHGSAWACPKAVIAARRMNPARPTEKLPRKRATDWLLEKGVRQSEVSAPDWRTSAVSQSLGAAIGDGRSGGFEESRQGRTRAAPKRRRFGTDRAWLEAWA